MPESKHPELPPSIADAQLELADIFANIAEFWGFTRTQGRIFGLVYMSPRPLSQSEIRGALEISAGSTSMTIASLLEWGVLHRQGRRYVAETNFFSLITRVMKQREAGEVDGAITRAERIVAALEADDPNDPDIDFALRRAKHVLGFFRAGKSVLDAFITRGPLARIVDRLARRASRLPRSSKRQAPLESTTTSGNESRNDDTHVQYDA